MDLKKKTLEDILTSSDNAGYTDEQLHTAYSLLDKLILNLIEHPTEEKYRVLRTDNITLSTQLFCIKEVHDILEKIGFHSEGGVYRFTNDPKAVAELETHYDEIHQHAKMIEYRHMSPVELEKELLLEQIHKEIDAEVKHRREEERARMKAQMSSTEKDTKDAHDNVAYLGEFTERVQKG